MDQFKVLKQTNNNLNLETNRPLKKLYEEALAQNVPKATVEKILKNSANNAEVSSEHIWEIRGPGRAALVVECLAKSRGAVPPIINPILRKNGSVEERGIINMFDRVNLDIFTQPGITSDIFCSRKEL